MRHKASKQVGEKPPLKANQSIEPSSGTTRMPKRMRQEIKIPVISLSSVVVKCGYHTCTGDGF